MGIIAAIALCAIAIGAIYGRRLRALRRLEAEIRQWRQEDLLRGTLEWKATAFGTFEPADHCRDGQAWQQLIAQTHIAFGTMPPEFRVIGIEDQGGERMVCIRIGGRDSAAYLWLELRGIVDVPEAVAVDIKAHCSIGRKRAPDATLRAEAIGNGFVRLTGTLQNSRGDATPVDATLHPAVLETGHSSLVYDESGLTLHGTLGAKTFAELDVLLAGDPGDPGEKTLTLKRIHSALSSDFVLLAGQLIRNRGLATNIEPDQEIYMAGVELFVAGAERSLVRGAKLYVHRWTDHAGRDAKDLPADHPFHRQRRDYFAEMLGPAGPAFYDFTLDFAQGEHAKLLGEDDIVRFGLATVIDDDDYATEQAIAKLSRTLDVTINPAHRA